MCCTSSYEISTWNKLKHSGNMSVNKSDVTFQQVLYVILAFV